jgi:hypothetical protein
MHVTGLSLFTIITYLMQKCIFMSLKPDYVFLFSFLIYLFNNTLSILGVIQDQIRWEEHQECQKHKNLEDFYYDVVIKTLKNVVTSLIIKSWLLRIHCHDAVTLIL